MTPASLTAIAREQLITDEGVRTHPYRDSTGVLTIGVGRNLEAVGLSLAEVYYLLDNDIASAAHACAEAFTPWFDTLDPVRQAVLVQMAFNLGIAGLLKFVDTLAAIQRRDYSAAAEHMLTSKWARQVGGRALRLAAQMERGTP